MKNLFLILFFIPAFANAQQLIIEGASPNLYLEHKTAAKESFYSIGRLYNISPKEIAPFNRLVLENGLTIGQVIKIPLTEVNFSQSLTLAPDEALVPLYHIVKNKETLFHISAVNNKAPLADLKSWNKLKSEAVVPGTKLVVGYLKVKKDLSALASKGVKGQPAAKPMEVVEHALDKPVPDEVLKPVTKSTKDVTISSAQVMKEEPTVENIQPKKELAFISANNKEGYFKNLFISKPEKNIKEETGIAGTFKSTSGWEDNKYYCLHNSAPAGTIIKITANQVTVYAKVLDIMPDMNQNEGMVIRISSAAAAALGMTDSKFECLLNY
ncbi:MAG: LysM peptidoglycan-binding domain-containing protein [Ferruginibacter sp.]